MTDLAPAGALDTDSTWLRRAVRRPFALMLASSVLSLIASFVLSVDAVRLAANPDVVLTCDINSAISCGAVAQAWQASLFGFPNAFLGLVAEPVVVTIALASLGGVRFPRWFMVTAQGVYLLGLVFAYWLFAQSYLVIGALCPWCLLVTASTTTVFTSLLRVNILQNNFRLRPGTHARAVSLLRTGVDYAAVVVVFVLLAAAIIVKYHNELFG
ncbi:vitamin K epoxide reductase family protein [Georgenia yuyongxinii]|uniref:Vitamin K epoxide reductase family protein n=1 Tax=Georgenia yuyongxinii TaxID=2589797 RepID=A0A552WMD7_9MICO|nr:vitamin K epoxide reductase family protein [Georgenia yuyongxinii]TRW43945.1 vitamin K epoxide reductase family protein [Georgenia yuyongxinii]